ncbi:MAG TPA: hypothetical protein GX393_01795 [Firmicutes bacterium]|mgnify:FL=1|jgi:hypothetical protein|nr:hypothetical protein [Bacillota bacterium]
MTYRGIYLPVAALVFILLLASGLFGKNVYEQRRIVLPLQSELQEAQGVQSASLQREARGKLAVYLELDPETPLSITLAEVRRIADRFGTNIAVYVRDSASPELVRIFERVQLAAEEAIMTGEFTLLEERVQTWAAAAGVSCELAVDRDFIYVSLIHGPSVLWRAISRSPGGEAAVSVEGGALAWRNG